VIRLDAMIVIAHSDKEQAKGMFKGSYGHHPLTAWCDNTGESLAVLLRPGNVGANTAADHVAVTGAAICTIAARYRRKMLITCDGAGSTHALVDHVTALKARGPLPGSLLRRARLRRVDQTHPARPSGQRVTPMKD